MPSDREIKVQKEEKLYDIHMANRLIKAKKYSEAEKFLDMVEVRTHSGMTAEEIDAVSDRVTRTLPETAK